MRTAESTTGRRVPVGGATGRPGAPSGVAGAATATVWTTVARRAVCLYRRGRRRSEDREVAVPVLEPDAIDAHDRLVARALDGDVDAWEELYLAVYPRLYGYAAHRVAADAARDVVSETMARALANVARFRRGGVFEAWLFGICRNVIREHLRHIGRPSPPADRAACDTVDPADVVAGLDEQATLRHAFAQLPERDREILELRVVAELSADAVAEVLHKHPGAIRMAQSRALGRLRLMLLTEGVRA